MYLFFKKEIEFLWSSYHNFLQQQVPLSHRSHLYRSKKRNHNKGILFSELHREFWSFVKSLHWVLSMLLIDTCVWNYLRPGKEHPESMRDNSAGSSHRAGNRVYSQHPHGKYSKLTEQLNTQKSLAWVMGNN